MTHRQALKRGLQVGAVIVSGAAMALMVGGAQTGCGGGGGSAGTGGGSGGNIGSAGTGGNTSGGSTGTAGTGGGNGACRNDFLEVTANITTDTTWPCNSYVLKQKVHVDGGSSVATLTIAAGSTIYGDGSPANPAALISTRNGRLIAIGTPTAPITFTSYAPVGQRTPGDTFAGVVMLGRAYINRGVCVNGTGTCPPPAYFQDSIEGIPADDPKGQFGGTDDTWNCGEIKYTRIQFAGYTIGEGNELNGLTLGACGSQTHVSYTHVHRGFDDGIECFGGAANFDHIVISGSVDDGFDWDQGFAGKVQFLIVHEAYAAGDKAYEADNFQQTQTITPRSDPEIWNATLISTAGSSGLGMHLRRGTWYKLRNHIIYNFSSFAVDVDAETNGGYMPATDWPTNMSIESSVFFGGPIQKPESLTCDIASVAGCTNNDYGFDEAAAIMDPARMNVTTVDPMFESTLTGTVITAHPSYIPGNAAGVTGKATPPAPFDTTATYAGAVDPATAPGSAWYDGWTEFPAN